MKGGGREDSGGEHEVHAGPEWGVSRYSALQEAKTLALFDGGGVAWLQTSAVLCVVERVA